MHDAIYLQNIIKVNLDFSEVDANQWMQRSIQLHFTWLLYCSKLLVTSKQFVEDRRKVFVGNPSDSERESLVNAFEDVAVINEDMLPSRFSRNQKFECPDSIVKEYSGALHVFLVGRDSALHLTTVDGMSEKNLEIVEQLSQLYKILAFYEGLRCMRDNTCCRMSKMHKRRITLWKSMLEKNIGNIFQQKRCSFFIVFSV